MMPGTISPPHKFSSHHSVSLVLNSSPNILLIAKPDGRHTNGWIEAATTLGPSGVQDELLRGAKEAIVNTPRRIGSAISGVVGAAKKFADPAEYKGIADNPIVNLPGEVGAGLVQGMTEPLMSPRTTGEAFTGGAIDTTLLVKGAQVLGGMPGRVASNLAARDKLRLAKGKNQLITVIEPTPRNIKAVENGYHHIDEYVQNTGAKWKDVDSFAKVAEDAEAAFEAAHIEPINNALKGVPEYGPLKAKRAELNKALERMGYFEKDSTARAIARSSPAVQELATQKGIVQASLNELVDKMAPVSGGASNLMNQWSDLIQISRQAHLAGVKNDAARRVAMASAPGATRSAATKVVEGVSSVTSAPWRAGRKMVTGRGSLETPALSPDTLARRAANNLTKKSPVLRTSARRAIDRPPPIQAEPIKLPGAKSANTATETGQVEMPFVPQEVGGIPQQVGGFEGPQRGLFDFEVEGASPERAALRAQADAIRHPSDAPQQLALPPRTGGDIVPSGAEPIQLPSNAQRPLLAERSVVSPPDTTPPPARTLPVQPRERTPASRQDELLQNFGGTIRSRERGPSAAPPSKAPPLPEAEPIMLPSEGQQVGGTTTESLIPMTPERQAIASVAERQQQALQPETKRPRSGRRESSVEQERRRMERPTIGEAAITPDATITDAQNLRFQGAEGAADFVETMDTTSPSTSAGNSSILSSAETPPIAAPEPVKLPVPQPKPKRTGKGKKSMKAEESKAPAPPFVSSIAPSAGGTSFKEQKTSVLSQVDEALKNIPEKPDYEARVKFKVPGAGEFNIVPTKDALTEFRSRVVKQYPTNEGPRKPPALRSTTNRRLEGEGIEYYNPYRARKQEVVEGAFDARKQINKNYSHEGWFSNGHYAIKSEPPSGITPTDMPALKEKVTPPAKLTPAEVQGEFYYQKALLEEAKPSAVSYQPGYKPARPDLESTPKETAPKVELPDDEWMKHPVAHVVGGKSEAMLDPQYVDAILTKYPKAKPYLGEEGTQVFFKDGGEVVGIVMPIKGKVPSRFEGRIKEVKLGVEPVNLPGEGKRNLRFKR